MSELDRKADDKKKAEKADRKRRANVDDQDDAKEETINLIPWDADVDRFLELLNRSLNDLRVSMGSGEFKTLSQLYRDLTPTEKRAVSNRMQKRLLGNLLRALHAGDYRMYMDGWETEAEAATDRKQGPRSDNA